MPFSLIQGSALSAMLSCPLILKFYGAMPRRFRRKESHLERFLCEV